MSDIPNLDSAPFTEWLEDGCRALYEGPAKPKSICLMARMDDDNTIVGFWNAIFEDKVLFASQINRSAMIDLMKENRSLINDILEEDSEEEVGDDA